MVSPVPIESPTACWPVWRRKRRPKPSRYTVLNTLAKSVGRVGANRDKLNFVTFLLGEENFAVSVGDVYGIYHGLPVIPNPDGPPYLEGEVQFKDRRVPVVNLRRFAGMSEPCDHHGRWIILIHDSSGPVGVVVDHVTEVIRLKPGGLEPAPDNLAGPVSDYITAVVRYQGQSMLVPDFNRLIHDIIPQ